MNKALHGNTMDKFASAIRAAVPLLFIETPDAQMTIQQIVERAGSNFGEKDEDPVIVWDMINGVRGLNEAGQYVVIATYANNLHQQNPVSVLSESIKLTERTVLIHQNTHLFLDNPAMVQAVSNLRDPFKGHQCMLVMIGPTVKLPPELTHDVLVIDQPLPTDTQVREVIQSVVDDNSDQLDASPSTDQMDRAARSLRGSTLFAAEQVVSMSLQRDGLQLDRVRQLHSATIDQTPGLSVEKATETFADIGGLSFAKEFAERLCRGPRAPVVVCRIEEIEKTMAGAAGDMSGTSQDSLQVLLSECEDNNWSGLIAYGCPGSGKTLFAKALANSSEAHAIRLDLSACKGSLVGQSEQRVRAAMKVLKAIGGDRVFFVASCNGLDTLPPELQRRFRCGVWYFDPPSAKDRMAIWHQHAESFGCKSTLICSIETEFRSVDEDGLTGADIRNICETAYTLDCDLKEARQYVIPLYIQSPKTIEACRQMAEGRFIDASAGGVFRAASSQNGTTKRTSRTLRVAGMRHNDDEGNIISGTTTPKHP